MLWHRRSRKSRGPRQILVKSLADEDDCGLAVGLGWAGEELHPDALSVSAL